MKTTIVTLLVALVAGVLVLAIMHKYFSARSPGSAASAPTRQAARAPSATPELSSPSATVSNELESVQPRPRDHRAAEKRKGITALYEAARTSLSVAERDKQYATLVGDATRERDFELAIDIAGSLSSAVKRDNNYTKIVYQAILARDFSAADKAARKISSVVVRDEQLNKIVQACPADAVRQ